MAQAQYNELIDTLEKRFKKNMHRHPSIEWTDVENKLLACLRSENLKTSEQPNNKLYSLLEMERTGGEPDVVEFDIQSEDIHFADCSKESPIGRRSVCYDSEGQNSRKEHRPENNAVDMAADMGIKVLDEEEYRYLQQFGPFDTKTSSWLKTPDEIRKLGGAIFGDFRYGKVFVYHNGAQSYYSARGFRGLLRF
ncbi:MAG: DUF4256 domain-containing protein [Prolixibacteraceae bacterium]|jgi:hypothetical protein|nr:DUF4256 domain-containing protein [Prolixibacteraceae bacterium]